MRAFDFVLCLLLRVGSITWQERKRLSFQISGADLTGGPASKATKKIHAKGAKKSYQNNQQLNHKA